MEIPNLVRERLGGESIEATVNLGDEDVICVTPTRTILYRGEGLLSDESVSVYSHDIERLNLSVGRRNTKFSLTYVDGTKEFKVPGDRADTLLQILMQGVLRVAGVADEDESVAGVFQFSELTLVVTESRLIKHIGAPVWDDDFEVFDYDDVTALDFEEGSVATQIILTVSGRPQRIKAPSEQAPKLKQTLTQTLCAYYDVSSLAELTEQLAENEDETDGKSAQADTSPSGFELDDGISPLVSDSGDDEAAASGDQSSPAAAASGDSPSQTGRSSVTEADTPKQPSTTTTSKPPSGEAGRQTPDQGETASAPTTESADQSAPTTAADAGDVDPADIDAIKEQLSTLTEAVKRQNELLRQHNERLEANDEKVDTLIEELRRGR
ncbi:MAG: PH domain-containing protein [Haloarculaceae archaeon]